MADLIFKHSAMNGGKTLNILQTAYNYEERFFKTVIIKSVKDTKGADTIVSRTGMYKKVDILLPIEASLIEYDYYEIYKDAKSILVDEVEMLSSSQVEDLWYIAHKLDIPVITYGLKSNFKGEIFSDGITKLFAVADKIEEIGSTNLCACGNKATFNSRKVNNKFTSEGNVIVIDGTANVEYIPLCSDCYLQNVKFNDEKLIKLEELSKPYSKVA